MKFVFAVNLLLLGTVLEASPWGVVRGPGFEQPLETRDAAGAATLTDAQLPAGATELVFTEPAGSVVSVGLFSLTNRTLRIASESSGLVLQAAAATNVFDLAGGNWTFDSLDFLGRGFVQPSPYRGGAIDVTGGALTVTNCTFAEFGRLFAGGAICACCMTGDVTITACAFATNRCSGANGTGGAVYVSGLRDRASRFLLEGCSFEGNAAKNGGAVTTMCTISDDESAIALSVRGCTFVGNAADYSGGAIDAAGEVEIESTTFDSNRSGVLAGALCLRRRPSGEDPAACRISPPTVFRGNSVQSETEWTGGGAIAIWGDGSVLSIDGRHVRFVANEVTSPDGAFGGAVYVGEGASASVATALFANNIAENCGGAIYAVKGLLEVSTSVFSNNTVTASDDNGYGGAISAEEAQLSISNVTVRLSNHWAIDAHKSSVHLINSVIVDNQGDPDIRVEGSAPLRMDYVSYGQLYVSENLLETLVTNDCIKGCTAAIYDGDSLELYQPAANPVAQNGLRQKALDYRRIAYGWSTTQLSSMGAFQCPTPKDDPIFKLTDVTWFHNRWDGHYYPRVTIRYLGGNASRLKSFVLSCDGVEHALPEACLETLRGATMGGTDYAFGVTDEYWATSVGGFGYITATAEEQAQVMLFFVDDPTRASVAVVEAGHPVEFTATVESVLTATTTTARPRLSAAALPQTHSVPAAFTSFGVGTALTGSAEVPRGASVTLLGCTELGSAWESLGVVTLDGDGRFEADVPDGFHFFRLEAEVAR